jgi:hypothetical protein
MTFGIYYSADIQDGLVMHHPRGSDEWNLLILIRAAVRTNAD